MEVDDERKGAVSEPVTVDATNVTDEKEEEGKPSWAHVGRDETLVNQAKSMRESGGEWSR